MLLRLTLIRERPAEAFQFCAFAEEDWKVLALLVRHNRASSANFKGLTICSGIPSIKMILKHVGMSGKRVGSAILQLLLRSGIKKKYQKKTRCPFRNSFRIGLQPSFGENGKESFAATLKELQ